MIPKNRRGDGGEFVGANDLKKPTHDDVTIATTCPNCGDITRKPFGWLLRHAMYACGKCGSLVQVDPGARKEAEAYASLVKALDDLFGEFFEE